MSQEPGRSHRRALLDAHRKLSAVLELKDSPFLGSQELSHLGINQLAPLSWEPTVGAGSKCDHAELQPVNHSGARPRDPEDSCLAVVRKRTCPWVESLDLNLESPHLRCRVSEHMDDFLVRSLRVSAQDPLPGDLGGWRALDSDEQRLANRHMRSYLTRTYTGPSKIRSVRYARHGCHAWCAVADGTLADGSRPDDNKLLRSEISAALLIARDRMKLSKAYTQAIYPVIVVSYSMFYVRILQIHADVRRRCIVLRKTPYLHLENRNSDNLKLVQQWYMSQPTGETRLKSPLGGITEEEEYDMCSVAGDDAVACLQPIMLKQPHETTSSTIIQHS